MGIRLRTQLGYAVLGNDAKAKIKESFKNENAAHPDWDDYSTFIRDGDLQKIITAKLGNSSLLQAECDALGLDVYEVKLGLEGSIDMREPEGPCDIPAVKGCDQFKEKSVNELMLLKDGYCSTHSRYGDLIDSYLFNNINGHTIKLLGAGIWPATGYRAKKSFDGFEKDRVYFWGDVIGFTLNKLKEAGISLADAEKTDTVSAVIGYSNEFHPVIPDSIFYMLFCYFQAQNEPFDKSYWSDKLFPCVLFEWC